MKLPGWHSYLTAVHVKIAVVCLQRLESVSNLTVVPINSTTVLISWSPPFTLEGVPILGYNVTITNTTSGENETMSVKGTLPCCTTPLTILILTRTSLSLWSLSMELDQESLKTLCLSFSQVDQSEYRIA